MRQFSRNKENKKVRRHTLLFVLVALFFAAVFLLPPISYRSAWAADAAIESLKDVELTGVSDGKTVKVGELAKGTPFFLVFSTAT